MEDLLEVLLLLLLLGALALGVVWFLRKGGWLCRVNRR